MNLKEGIVEKPPVQPGGGTEPEKAALNSGFGWSQVNLLLAHATTEVRGRLPPLLFFIYL
jgi:hypothetical protein